MTIVDDRGDLPRAMVDAYTYGDVALVEQRITGTEIAVGIIDTGDGPVALPAVEIEPLSGVYSFEARYNAGETRFYMPARISTTWSPRARPRPRSPRTARSGCATSRASTSSSTAPGTPWFLEANVLPGLTETSLLPQALEAAGHDLGWVYAALGRGRAIARIEPLDRRGPDRTS